MRILKIWIFLFSLLILIISIDLSVIIADSPTPTTKVPAFPMAIPETEYSDLIIRLETGWRAEWPIRKIAQEVGMNVENFSKLNNLEKYNPNEKFPFSFFKCIPYSDCDTALVSWYGPGFNGKQMANGETFRFTDPTICAHKVLPFGTNVKITHIETGKSIIVTVKDRGPFIENRHFDISQAAAERLGIIETGVAKCRIEIVK